MLRKAICRCIKIDKSHRQHEPTCMPSATNQSETYSSCDSHCLIKTSLCSCKQAHPPCMYSRTTPTKGSCRTRVLCWGSEQIFRSISAAQPPAYARVAYLVERIFVARLRLHQALAFHRAERRVELKWHEHCVSTSLYIDIH